MKLEIEDYNQLEKNAIENLPNRVVEMCRTVMFNSEGYPSRVSKKEELWKFLDVMHETRFEHNLKSFFDGYLSKYEFENLKKIAETSLQYSNKEFNKKIIPTGSLLRAIQIFRFIDSLFSYSNKNVFEIGPGSGHLGALLLSCGIKYSCTDITQAFYLHQSRWLNFVSGGNFQEALNVDDVNKCENNCHIPWWIYAQLYSHRIPQFSIVTCNAALAEMHINSLKYTIKISSLMLHESNGYFVFESWGYDKYIKSPTIHKLFLQNGFELQWNSHMLTVYKKISAPTQISTNNNNLESNIYQTQNTAFQKQKRNSYDKYSNSIFKRLFPVQNRQLDLIYNFVNLNKNQKILTLENFEPWESDLGTKIIGYLNSRKVDNGKINSEKIIYFYQNLLNSYNIRSEDEKILDFIGSSYV